MEADGSESSQSFFLGNSFITGAFRLLNANFIDNALRGQLFTPAQAVDQCFADDVTSQLFRYVAKEVVISIAIAMRSKLKHGVTIKYKLGQHLLSALI